MYWKKIVRKLVLFLINKFDLKKERELILQHPKYQYIEPQTSKIIELEVIRVESKERVEMMYGESQERYILNELDKLLLQELRKSGAVQYAKKVGYIPGFNEGIRASSSIQDPVEYKVRLRVLKIVDQDCSNNTISERIYDRRAENSFP